MQKSAVLNTRQKGNFAEKAAENFLRKQGYQILARNYYKFYGELDIIASFKDEVIFVEVKSLENENFISLEETISRKKTLRLTKIINSWLSENHKQESFWRLDFIGLVIESGKIKKLKHLEAVI
jgi:putative endonuclease